MTRTCSPETRAKLSRSMMGNKNAKGIVRTKEWRVRQAARMLGSKRSPESCAKQSAQLMGAHRGKENFNWRGGRHVANGYVRIYLPDHPFANVQGYVFEHRVVMEAHLGRTLLPQEVVHHINGVTDDNRIENLMLFSSNAEHRRNHQRRKS